MEGSHEPTWSKIHPGVVSVVEEPGITHMAMSMTVRKGAAAKHAIRPPKVEARKTWPLCPKALSMSSGLAVPFESFRPSLAIGATSHPLLGAAWLLDAMAAHLQGRQEVKRIGQEVKK